MIITLEKLFTMQQSLSRIMNIPLEAKLSYRLSKILKKIIAELNDLESERQKLVSKFGEKDEKGNVKVKGENLTKFSDVWKSLLSEEVELDIPKVPFEMIEKIQISSKELLDLEDLIESPKEEK